MGSSLVEYGVPLDDHQVWVHSYVKLFPLTSGSRAGMAHTPEPEYGTFLSSFPSFHNDGYMQGTHSRNVAVQGPQLIPGRHE